MAPHAACTAPTGDWAIDDKTALLFSTEAPFAQKTGARDDVSAVWAFVPDAFDFAKPEVLFYFHGHNNFVKVGFCDHTEGLAPDWVIPVRRGELAAKASGPKYGLNSLPTTPHAPLVLVPEVGIDSGNRDTSRFPGIDRVMDTEAHLTQWRADKKAFDIADAAFKKAVKDKVDPLPPKPVPPVPPAIPAFAVIESGGRMASDLDQVKKMIDDCCDRLRHLPKRVTTASTYLDTTPAKLVDSSKLKRLYLTGHSGGGVPLAAACKNNIARLTGADDLPTDLWVFDATYGGGLDAYTSFCKTLFDAKKLGNGPKLSRFVGVTIKNSATDVSSKENPPPRMTDIVAKMKADGVPVAEIEFADDADIPKVDKTVACNPVTIIRIAANQDPKKTVQHDQIPGKFIPILLKTAGTKGPDCGGTGTTGFNISVIDTNNQALPGAGITVKQNGNTILASKLDSSGKVFVQGHDLSQPCDIFVEGFGGMGKEGCLDVNDPDDGTLPEYDAGIAPDGDGSCGGDFTPPEIIT